ncbi:MAG: site-2 protease family protein [Candidatus Aminicenantaceae bacterium]
MEILSRILAYVVLLFSITIHESAHGWTANKFGDPTAYNMGRVTLNPIPHIDPIGTLLFPLIMMITGIPFIGWAKPVPVNPYNLKDPKKDNLWISFSGPLSNLMAAGAFIIAGVILKSMFILPSIILPILFYGALINSILAVFNLIPIPPLDGSGILMGFLSDEAAEKYEQIRPFGFLIILGLLFIGFLNLIFNPIYTFISKVLLL